MATETDKQCPTPDYDDGNPSGHRYDKDGFCVFCGNTAVPAPVPAEGVEGTKFRVGEEVTMGHMEADQHAYITDIKGNRIDYAIFQETPIGNGTTYLDRGSDIRAVNAYSANQAREVRDLNKSLAELAQVTWNLICNETTNGRDRPSAEIIEEAFRLARAFQPAANQAEREVAFHRGVDAAKNAIRKEATTDNGRYFAAIFYDAIDRKCGTVAEREVVERLAEMLQTTAYYVHGLGGYHSPQATSFADCDKSICIKARLALTAFDQLRSGGE